jgi:hypothetical protein
MSSLSKYFLINDNTRIQFIIATTVIFYLIGGFGNVISIMIFNNKLLKTQPTTGYIQSFFVINILTILYMPIQLVAPILITNTFSCKFSTGIFLILLELQAWVTAISSFDRLISVYKPCDYLFKNKFKFQIIVMISSLVLVTILLLPTFIYMDAVILENQTMCFFMDIWSGIYTKYQYILFRVAFPFIVMIVSSLIITYKMCKIKARISTNQSRKREANLFKALIFSDLFFILFRLPMVFYIILHENGLNVLNNFEYSIYLAIGLLNNVLMFLLLLASNRIYRKLFFEYMSCRKDLQNIVPNDIVLIAFRRRDNQM